METYFLLMIYGGGVFVLFSFFTVLNVSLTFSRFGKHNSNTLGNMDKGMGRHILLGFISSIGAMVGMGGLIWFLIEKFATGS